jgi:DedD protein
MDTGLKQRLIGASVLIVLAVIFVPMLIDRPAPTTADVGLPTEPQPPADFGTRVVPLTPPTARPAAPPVPPPDDLDRVATVDANTPERVDAVSGERVGGGAVTAPAAGSASPAAPAPEAGAMRREPPSASTAPPPASPAAATSGPVATPPAAASTAAAPTAPRPPATAGAGRFLVVFGSFGQPANANALIADLRGGGIEARGEPTEISGRPATRVVAGPFRDRAAAEQIRLSARQVRADLSANIVEIDETAAARAATAAASAAAPASSGGAAGTGWAVQIGAFRSVSDAGAQRDRLRTAGFAAFIDEIRTEGGTLYRVRVGPTAQRAGAEQLRADLRARLGVDGLVVTHP